MPNRASDLVLTRLIAPGYAPGFLTSPAAVADAALPPGFTLLEVIYGTDFKGLFGQEVVPYGIVVKEGSSGQVVVAIRGTDSVLEWLEDGWAVPEPWPFAATGGRTHKGFTDVYQTLTAGGQPLQGYLEALGGLIVVTGHSLGAALANLLAAALGTACRSCTTFEGPRVGDVAFCNWMDDRLAAFWRYVIIGDVVPHVPPEALGYSHAGTEIELDPAGVIPLTLDPKVYLESHHQLSSVQELLSAP
jgi:triacylglycerol lipase